MVVWSGGGLPGPAGVVVEVLVVDVLVTEVLVVDEVEVVELEVVDEVVNDVSGLSTSLSPPAGSVVVGGNSLPLCTMVPSSVWSRRAPGSSGSATRRARAMLTAPRMRGVITSQRPTRRRPCPILGSIQRRGLRPPVLTRHVLGGGDYANDING